MGAIDKWLPKQKNTPAYNLSSDYTKWPWVSANKGVPNSSGIYIISIVYGLTRKRKLMYVGESGDLKARLLSHECSRFLKAVGFEVKIHFLVLGEASFAYDPNRTKLEKYLIEATQAPLNDKHCTRAFSIAEMIRDDLFGT